MSATKKKPTVPAAKPVEAVVPTPKKPVEAAAPVTKKAVDQVAKVKPEPTAKSAEKVVEVTRERVAVAASAGNDVFDACQDVISYGKDNFDAVLNANSVFSKGMQEINNEILACFQATFEDGASATQKIFACANVQDVVKLQNELVQSTYTKAVDQSKKITDMSVKVTEDSAVPLSQRINVTVEKIVKPLAA